VHPILVDFGTWTLPLLGERHLYLPTYGFLFASGALLAWWWFLRRARALRLPEDRVFNLGFYALLAGIAGAKATLLLVDIRYYVENPWEVLGSLRSAGVLLGGVLCGALAFAAYARHAGLPLWRLADAAAPPLALAQGIGRLGCFAAGCCYGVPGSFCAVTFRDSMAAAQTGVPLHVPLVPVQLVQMGTDLLLAAVLAALGHGRRRREGSLFWIYVLLYGATRSVIEIWRGDTVRGTYFGGALSTSQILGGAAAGLAAVMLARGYHRRETAGAP
jgi:phosphatidylglycerol:prolipoprotein diacylglycerol transferase